MPNASASRTIAAPVLQLWEVIRDPITCRVGGRA